MDEAEVDEEPLPEDTVRPQAAEDEPSLLRSFTRVVIKDFRVTCATCRNDVIAVGSFTGLVKILDADTFKEITSFKTGAKAVYDLSFDRSGTILASSNKDGRISVRTLSRKQNSTVIDVDEKHYATFVVPEVYPLRVAVDPQAYVNGDYGFASGGSEGRVMVTRKNWLFTSNTVEVAPLGYVDGPISKLMWRGDIVAWTSAKGSLRMRDVKYNIWVHITPDDALEDEKVDDFYWENDENLFLVSDMKVKILKIKRSQGGASSVAVVSIRLETTCQVSYVMPFGGRNGSILTVGTDGLARLIDRMSGAMFCSLWLVPVESSSVIQPATVFFHDSFWSDSLLLRPDGTSWSPSIDDPLPPTVKKTIQEETSLPYLFAFHNVVSNDGAKAELVVMRSRTVEDCLQHALGMNDFEKALQIAHGAYAERWCSMSEADVSDAYMTYLLSAKKYEMVSEVMPRIVKDMQAWTKWSIVLAERREVYRVVDHLPVPGLPSALYDAALSQLLERKDQDELYTKVLRRFLPSVDASRCVSELEEAIPARPSSKVLKQALALAYSAIPQRIEEGFWALLDSASPDALEVLERRQEGFFILMKTIERVRVAELCKLDENRFLSLVLPLAVSNPMVGTGPPTDEDAAAFTGLFPSLISQLVANKSEGVALKLLRRWNASRRSTGEASTGFVDLYDLEVELCARVDPQRLLELLRDSNGYSPDKALQLCRLDPSLRRETVFLLQRIGGPKHSREALEVMAYEMKDLDLALEYAEREGLFDELVKVCVHSKAPPGAATELLSRAGSYTIDPACLVRALPSGLPDVRIRLIKLFRDVRANQRTRSVANTIFAQSAGKAAVEAQDRYSRAVRVRPKTKQCAWCKRVLVEAKPVELVIFRTGDSYHERCLREAWESLYKHSTSNNDEDVVVQSSTTTSLLKLHVHEYIRYSDHA